MCNKLNRVQFSAVMLNGNRKFARPRTVCALLLSILLQLNTSGVRGQSACPDEYTYTQQPPTEIVCNPYLSARLMLDCAVSGAEDIEIQWYFSQASIDSFAEDTVRIENSSKYLVTPRHIENGVGLSLVVNDLNEANDTGMYWCQATVGSENTLLTQSGAFMLYDTSFYAGLPFKCPGNIFLRNSDTRCAAVVIIEPEETTVFPSPTPTPSLSLFSTSSVHLPVTSPAETYFSSTSMAALPASITAIKPSTTDMPITADPTVGTDQPPEMDGLASLDEVLFAILGIVVVLLILCVTLGVVIFVLCRKRRQKVGLEGYEKDSGQNFDQDSTQSVVFRSGAPFKGRHGANLSIAISSSSRSPRGSGDYAEIGPALMALRLNNFGNTHEYSEIPELPSPRRRNENVDRQARGVENPYDELILPPDFQARQSVPATQRSAIQPEQTRGDTNTENSLQGYQILERIPNSADHHQVPHLTTPPTSSPPPSPPSCDDDEADDVPTPPVSPHNYHTLEDSPSCPELEGEDYIYPAITECSTMRLASIPEHPYHVLEGNSLSPSLGQDSPLLGQDSPLLGRDSSEETVITDLGIKEATPDFVDPEVKGDGTLASQDTSIDFENREYDRLVGPLRLYHILERSPPDTRPKIRGVIGAYDRLDCGREGMQFGLSRGVRFLSQQTEETTVSSVSGFSSEESSSLDPEPDVFDDPQYTFSPKRKVGKTRSDGGVHQPCGKNNSAYVPDDLDLAKYCGNYERDPCYMARLHRMSTGQNRSKAAEDCTDYASCSSVSVLGILREGSSLPDITHVYQSLESDTRDPLQPYEKLKRTYLKKETSI